MANTDAGAVLDAGIVFCWDGEEFPHVDYVVCLCQTDDLRRAQKSHGRDGHHSHDPRPGQARAAQLLEWKFCQECSLELSSQSTPGYHFLPAGSAIIDEESVESKKVLAGRDFTCSDWGGRRSWLHKTQLSRPRTIKHIQGFILSRLAWNQGEQKITKDRANCILTSEPGNLL